jgi:hypothetical protein
MTKAMDPFKTSERLILGLAMSRAQIYISNQRSIDFKAQASSSNGRAPVSKSGCWGFESLLACHNN